MRKFCRSKRNPQNTSSKQILTRIWKVWRDITQSQSYIIFNLSKNTMKNYDTKTQQHIFSFKEKSQDFIVEENLPFELKGKWDVFFVLFEKQNKTTMDVVNHLCKDLGISRLTLGIAWLKDKKAMTRQWICIYKSALKKLWWLTM